jgi:zinc protease
MKHFNTKKKALFTAFLFIFSIALFTLGLSAQEKLPKIQFEKYELPNGLDVILHVDRSIPVVSVNVWYHVGSKNEKKGRTGFAHLFEHLMFEGSEHIPNFDEPMERIGGTNNGSTNNDRTNYWENLPSNYLEMGIWLEADRMGYLLPVMDQKKLDTQRGVVQNEKRQGVDNQPYGRAFEILMSMLFPSDHPYSWTVIGSLEDLGAATLEDVKDFFKMHYTPNNASLSIAGDFDPAAAKKLVEKYFASIPPGPPIEKLKQWIPTLDGVKRIKVTDKIELPRVYMAWHTPAYYASGDAEFDVLADALSSGKNSRLYKTLVYEKEIAQDVSAYQASRELSSTFHITVTARKGHTLDEIEKVVDFELNKIFKEGITDEELMRAKVNREASFIRRLERIGGFGGKADTLNQYNVYLGDPDGFQLDLDRYAKVTGDSVLKCAADYLDLNKRVIVHFLPQGDLTSGQSEFDRTKEPPPLPEPSFSPPEIQTATLSNGLELFLVEDHKLPLLQVNLVLKSGWASDPVDRPGAAALTADLMDEGTQSRSALQISDEIMALGAFLGSGSSFDSSSVSLNVLKSKLDKGLELMTDIVLNPTFPEEELQRKKKIYLGRIQQESRQPFPSAIKLFLSTLFGKGHPYAQPYTGSGTPESINAIAQKDLVNYYRANYVPNNAAVVIAGDITLSDAKSKIQKAFGSWKKRNVKKASIAEPKALQSTKIYILDKPGAAQSVECSQAG